MYFYNLLSELNGMQVSMMIIVNSFLLSLLLFKLRIKFNTGYIRILSFGILISIISAFFVIGRLGGTNYTEYFGWPIQFYYLTRTVNDGPIPFSQEFNFIRFVLNCIYWMEIVIVAVFLLKVRIKNSNKYVLSLLYLFFILLVTFVISLSNKDNNMEPILRESEVVEIDKHENLKNVIAIAYPEFKDYEKQESFAGRSVKFLNQDNIDYVAYLEHGSGLPIVNATCFKIEEKTKVMKVGTFPDPTDSYAGYVDIDITTCKGIKAETKKEVVN